MKMKRKIVPFIILIVAISCNTSQETECCSKLDKCQVKLDSISQELQTTYKQLEDAKKEAGAQLERYLELKSQTK